MMDQNVKYTYSQFEIFQIMVRDYTRVRTF